MNRTVLLIFFHFLVIRFFYSFQKSRNYITVEAVSWILFDKISIERSVPLVESRVMRFLCLSTVSTCQGPSCGFTTNHCDTKCGFAYSTSGQYLFQECHRQGLAATGSWYSIYQFCRLPYYHFMFTRSNIQLKQTLTRSVGLQLMTSLGMVYLSLDFTHRIAL